MCKTEHPEVVFVANTITGGIGMCAGNSLDELYSIIHEDATQRVARIKDYTSFEIERHMWELYVIYTSEDGEEDVVHFGLSKLKKGKMR